MTRLILPTLLAWMAIPSSAFITEFDEIVGIPQFKIDEIERTLEMHRELFSIAGFADPEVCYPALEKADEDKSRLVKSEEYVTFVKEMGPDGYLDGIDTFLELPLILQVNFNVLACLCQTDPLDDACCVGENAAIRTGGSYEGDIVTPPEEAYLFLVCSLTSSAVERVLMSAPPTPLPTSSPTSSPSDNPTPLPTSSPTSSPSDNPTPSPTPFPTVSPTVEPSPAPTGIAPTPAPIPVPTPEPTTPEPTRAPIPTEAPKPVEEEVEVLYLIAVGVNGTREVYEPQLIDAMDAVSQEVLSPLVGRRLRAGRRLQSVEFPTTIDEFTVVDCPDIIPESDTCEEVAAAITLIFQPEDSDDSLAIAEEFSTSLDTAIAIGDLNAALQLLHPDTRVYIVDDTITGSNGGGSTRSSSISGGGITGIVIGSLAVVLAFGFLASRREPLKESEQLDPAPKNDDLDEEIAGDDAEYMPTLGAAGFVKGKDAMMDNDDIAPMSDESSNAGSSGWSSSAGVSSLNTGSQDGLSADAPISGIGAALAAVAGDKSKRSAGDGSTPPPNYNTPAVSRADLDSAIEAGDWAAVGATAALLAAASDSQSYSSQSGGRDQSAAQSQSESLDSSLDAARAAELDHLVESGDWEGVVLAAAKYEAAESRGESGSGSESRSNTAPDSAGSYGSSSPSKTLKRQELKAEVEELVKRVVPEEIQNVDEMMVQFRGREEELIETLRTMEERAVAQRARQGAQKQAKVEAKKKTAKERAADATALLAAIPGPGSPETGSKDSTAPKQVSRSLGTGEVTSPPTTKSLGSGQLQGTAKSKSLGTGTIAAGGGAPRDKKQSALEKAIEAGDWEAVGEAAVMLSDASLASSVETEEINRLADGISSQGSESAHSRSNLSDKAEELGDLIDKGDWMGVVNAASEAERAKEEKQEARRQRRVKQMKEEEEALAQAQIWEAIAEQTKQEAQEASTDQAASAAADWAIGRSLQALVQAEQGERLTGEETSRAETATDDEEEV